MWLKSVAGALLMREAGRAAPERQPRQDVARWWDGRVLSLGPLGVPRLVGL